MPIRAVLFDADGVVIFPWRFAQYLEREHGITPEMTKDFFHGIFNACLVGKADLREVLPPFLLKWGWKTSLDDFIAAWLESENAVDARVIAMIRSVRSSGLMCCLATSQERYRADYMATVMGFSEIFDRLYFSHSLGCQKPEPVYYGHIQRSLELPGESILFWDDSVLNVEAARRYGWNAEVYTDFDSFKEKLAEHLG